MGYIYFVGNEHGAIKIGFTQRSPHHRIQNLQIANADQLTILGILKGSVIEERNLHDRFSHVCIRGEWFEATNDLIGYVKSLSGADESKIQEWYQAILSKGNTSTIQRAIAIKEANAEQTIKIARRKARKILRSTHQEAKRILRNAKFEADEIEKDVRQKINDSVGDLVELVKEYAAVEVEKVIAHNVGNLIFNCRCCQCGQPRPTIRKRDDGLPWCDACWTKHAIFDSRCLDNIVTSVSEKKQKEILS